MDISQKPHGVAWWFTLVFRCCRFTLLFGRRRRRFIQCCPNFSTNGQCYQNNFFSAEDILTIGPINPWKFPPDWSRHMRVYSEDATGNAPAINVPHGSAVDKINRKRIVLSFKVQRQSQKTIRMAASSCKMSHSYMLIPRQVSVMSSKIHIAS